MLGFAAIAEAPIAALPDAMRVTFVGAVTYTAVATDDLRLYVATEEYISRIADTPSGQPFDGTLDKLPQFDRSIIGGHGFEGLTNGWGSAGIINAGADYDLYTRGYAVDGREAVFKAFDPTLPYSEAVVVARLIATSITVDDRMLTIGFEDQAFKLNVATSWSTYGGTGGLEGGSDLAGKRKPMCFGRVKNITPALLIANELVLQVSDGAINQISAVYDKGYPLTGPATDYATPTLLRAASIVDGSWATCLAYGLLRVASAYQQLTCDAQGDATGSYVETTGSIIRRIILRTGCLSDPAEVDIVAFANLEVDQPAPVGYYLDENSTETVAETFDRLSKGIGAFCGFTRLGMLQAGVFKAPAGTPVATFEDGCPELLEIAVEGLPSALEPPPWRQRVSYERNWTTISDPYPGVIETNPSYAAWLVTPYKTAATSQAQGDVILENRLRAQDPNIVETYFALEADALAEATRRLTLATSGYLLYRLKLKVPLFGYDVCQTMRVTDGRFGLSGGRLGRIAALSDIPDDDTVEVRLVA